MSEFKVDGHHFDAGVRGVVVIVCVFHDGFLSDGQWLFADRFSISRTYDALAADFQLWGVTLPAPALKPFPKHTVRLSANGSLKNDKFLLTVSLTEFLNCELGFS
jgi:hypothetical protein